MSKKVLYTSIDINVYEKLFLIWTFLLKSFVDYLSVKQRGALKFFMRFYSFKICWSEE